MDISRRQIQLDQTSRVYPELRDLIHGKNVLIIGSGADLDGRKLGKEIDLGKWDVVIRCNKLYGSREDTGTRTDVLFTRWNSWLDNKAFIPDEVMAGVKFTVIANQHIGVSRTEYGWLCSQVGKDQVSCGPQAVHWALAHGAARVDLIGFGRKQGVFTKDKVYPEADKETGRIPNHHQHGLVDRNPMYDWHMERMWLMRQPRVHFID